jgi:mitotic-spindle organizing protein 1
MPAEADPKQDKAANAAQARQVIDLFHEISTLLVRPLSLSSSLR